MQSGNLYVYCGNDPVMYSDRNGQSAELTLGWTSSMWWLPMCDGPLPIGDLVYFGGIVATSIIDTVNIVGIDNIALYINELTNAVSQVSEEVRTVSNSTSQSVSGGASQGDPNWGKGFDRFSQLKKYLGSAGKDHEWHHIVEQCQIRKSGFDAKMIHNTKNVISVPHDIHVKISAYYSSIDIRLCPGMRVRDYLATMSFAEQYEFGLKILRDFGVIQ